MRERLDLLFENDDKARWRMIALSALSVALWGFIGQLFGGAVRDLELASATVGAIVFSSQVLIYTRVPTRVLASIYGPQRRFVVSALVIAVSALAAKTAAVTGPRIQKVIYNRRLESALAYTGPRQPSVGAPAPTQKESVSSIVSYALQSGVMVRDDLIPSCTEELLAEAEDRIEAGNTVQGQLVLRVLEDLLSTITKRAVPVPPKYFASSIRTLDALQAKSPRPELTGEIRKVRLGLVEYRSRLETAIPDPKATRVLVPAIPPPGEGFFRTPAPDGLVVDLRNVPPGISIIGPGEPPIFSGVKTDNPDRPVFLTNGTQKLDNLSWVNVVFSNMLVQYSGGFVELSNVKFANCRFELLPSPRSDDFADYVAMGLSQLSNN